MKTKIAITFLFLSTVFLTRASANPGDPDPTFGTGGTYIDNPPSHPCYGMFPKALTLQSDGKILVVGKIYNQCSSYGFSDDPIGSRRVLLRRYNADGTPDNGGGTQTEFGMDGFGVAEIPIGINVYGEGFDVAVQPDGRILVAGSKAGRPGTLAAVWRFTTEGELDTTFGTDGVVTFTSNGTYNAARKLAIANGYIYVAGHSGPVSDSSPIWVRKLNPDGSLHWWFGSGGKITTGIEAESWTLGFAVHPTSNHIYVGGQIDGSAAVSKFFSSGTIFTNYGNFGTAILPDCTPGSPYTNTYPLSVLDLKFQSTGKLLVAMKISYGSFALGTGVLRLSGSGGIDTTFQNPTQMCNTVNGGPWIRTLPNDFFYAGYRFFPDGVTDTSFVPTAYGVSTALQPGDGKLVYTSHYSVANPGYSNSGSKVRLQRALP